MNISEALSKRNWRQKPKYDSPFIGNSRKGKTSDKNQIYGCQWVEVEAGDWLQRGTRETYMMGMF